MGIFLFYSIDRKLTEIYNKSTRLLCDLSMSEILMIGGNVLDMTSMPLGEYDKAIEYCKKGILENSEYPDNYGFLMTDIMIKKGEPELAEPYFRTALIKEPFNYNIILKVADYYQYTMNNLEKAYEYLNFASLIYAIT